MKMFPSYFRVNDNLEMPVPSEPVVRILEGSVELETLLPVSKLTGRREDPIMLLKMQFSKDSRLLDALLQELPTIQSDPNISDSDRFDVLAQRLATGSPAEDDALRSELLRVSDMLFPEQKKAVEQEIERKVSDIDFKGTEVPTDN